jgi:hypothetical protein
LIDILAILEIHGYCLKKIVSGVEGSAFLLFEYVDIFGFWLDGDGDSLELVVGEIFLYVLVFALYLQLFVGFGFGDFVSQGTVFLFNFPAEIEGDKKECGEECNLFYFRVGDIFSSISPFIQCYFFDGLK